MRCKCPKPDWSWSTPVAGAEVGTELAWDRIEELKKPRIIFINKMDRENANFDKAVESLRNALSGSRFSRFNFRSAPQAS